MSDATALGRAAAVVGDRGHVADERHAETGGLERAEGALTTGAGALHEHGHGAHAVILGGTRRLLGRDLRREGSRLARALKPRAPDEHELIVLPWTSVIVMIVLLNVERTCAMPVAMFFLTRFLLRPLPFGDAIVSLLSS